MKFVKRISLYFILPASMFAVGFYSNMKIQDFFYPNKYSAMENQLLEQSLIRAEPKAIQTALEDEQKITADTDYIIEEVDLKNNNSVETKWSIPDKYIGMNRQRLIKEMELYQASPSLKDQELGLVSVEVLSFSKAKVVLRKNYVFQEITTSFYLVNEKNLVVVYCDDLKTVYMHTDISLDILPDALKQEVIQNKYVGTEDELYNFLESYSS